MAAEIEATTRPLIRVILADAGGNWSAYAPAVPGVAGTGPTPEAARQSLEEGLTVHFEDLFPDELQAVREEVARMAQEETAEPSTAP